MANENTDILEYCHKIRPKYECKELFDELNKYFVLDVGKTIADYYEDVITPEECRELIDNCKDLITCNVAMICAMCVNSQSIKYNTGLDFETIKQYALKNDWKIDDNFRECATRLAQPYIIIPTQKFASNCEWKFILYWPRNMRKGVIRIVLDDAYGIYIPTRTSDNKFIHKIIGKTITHQQLRFFLETNALHGTVFKKIVHNVSPGSLLELYIVV